MVKATLTLVTALVALVGMGSCAPVAETQYMCPLYCTVEKPTCENPDVRIQLMFLCIIEANTL